jgi:hypothetical protein
MKRVLAFCLAVLALPGCNPVESGIGGASTAVQSWDGTAHALGSPAGAAPTFWVLDVVSVINTQKTIDDHIVSLISGDDCSTVKASMGEPYCQARKPVIPTVLRVSYCYKNLANTTCYDRPLTDGSTLAGTRTERVPLGTQ